MCNIKHGKIYEKKWTQIFVIEVLQTLEPPKKFDLCVASYIQNVRGAFAKRE